MVSLTGITAALTSVKTAIDISKGIALLRQDWEIQERLNEINRSLSAAYSELLSGQREQAALSEENEALKKEVARLKAWDGEKERYVLQAPSVHVPSAVAYRLKDECGGSEEGPWLCPTCFDDGIRSFLQPREGPRRTTIAKCPRCSTELQYYE